MTRPDIAVFALAAMLAVCLSSGDRASGAARQPQYLLAMSKDDGICKPLVAIYNRNVGLDVGPKSSPRPYPWPAPSVLALIWMTKSWQGLATDQRVLEKAYTVSEADVDGDGRMDLVVRLATWIHADHRFTALTVFPGGTVLPDQMDEYNRLERKEAVASW